MAAPVRLVPTHLVSFADRHMFPVYFDHGRHLIMVQADEVLDLLKGDNKRFERTLHDRLKAKYPVGGHVIYDPGLGGKGVKSNPTLTLSLEAFTAFLLWICVDDDILHVGLARLRSRMAPLVTRSGLQAVSRPFAFLPQPAGMYARSLALLAIPSVVVTSHTF